MRTRQEIRGRIWGVLVATNNPVRRDRAQHDLVFLDAMTDEEVARDEVQEMADRRYPPRGVGREEYLA